MQTKHAFTDHICTQRERERERERTIGETPIHVTIGYVIKEDDITSTLNFQEEIPRMVVN